MDDPSIDDISVEDLAGEYPTIRYRPPDDEFYVDLLSRIGTAIQFDDLEFTEEEFDGVRVRLATPATLVRMKRDTVRPIDKDDAARLRDHYGLEED